MRAKASPAARARMRSATAVFAVSAMGWVMLTAGYRGTTLLELCAAATGRPGANVLPPLELTLLLNPIPALAFGWFAMLVAMMPPLLREPIEYLAARGLRGWRAGQITAFLTGYMAVWLVAGAIIVPASLLMSQHGPTALAAALALAGLWHCSPLRQRSLNRCHRLPSLGACGPAALADSLRWGASQGVWCVLGCWAIMLLVTLCGDWHLPAMAVATIWLAAERLERPRPAGWGWQWPRKALRLLLPAPVGRVGIGEK